MTTPLGNLTSKDESGSGFNMATLGNLTKDEFESAFSMAILGNRDEFGSGVNMTILRNLTSKDESESGLNMEALGNLTNKVGNLTKEEFESVFNMTTPGNQDEFGSESGFNTTTLGNQDEFGSEFGSAFNTTTLQDLTKDEFESEFGSAFNTTPLGNQDEFGSAFNKDESGSGFNTRTYFENLPRKDESAVNEPEPNPKFPPELAARMAQGRRLYMCKKVVVQGFDHSLRRPDVRSALTNYFSSCGEVLKVNFCPPNAPISDPDTMAVLYIEGEDDAEDKALQLNDSDMGGGCKLTVFPLYPPPSTKPLPESYLSVGFTTPLWHTNIPKKKNKKKNKKKKNKYHT